MDTALSGVRSLALDRTSFLLQGLERHQDSTSHPAGLVHVDVVCDTQVSLKHVTDQLLTRHPLAYGYAEEEEVTFSLFHVKFFYFGCQLLHCVT